MRRRYRRGVKAPLAVTRRGRAALRPIIHCVAAAGEGRVNASTRRGRFT